MKQLFRIWDILWISVGILLLVGINSAKIPSTVSNSQVEACYPIESKIDEKQFTTTASWREMAQLKITTTVTKRDGTTIINDPNVQTVLVMDQAVAGDTSNFKYALFGAYDTSGERVDDHFYFLTTKNITVPFKIKTYVDQSVSADYRLANIQVDMEVTATQAGADGALNDTFGLNLPTTYFNVPSPIEGTANEYARSGSDNNMGYKEEANNLFTTIRLQ